MNRRPMYPMKTVLLGCMLLCARGLLAQGDPAKPDDVLCGRPYCAATPESEAAPVKIRASDGRVAEWATAERVQPKPPPLEATAFERFVQESLGKSLPVFGRRYFESSASFAGSGNIAVPLDYVVGPEDEVVVRAWGKIEIDARLTVDRYGQVFLPRVGTLRLAGVRYGQLAGVIRDAIARQFKDFELTVSLGQLRSMQIFVLGQARQPGVYTISSLSTLVNALFACGGPSSTGSLRDVQVRREGRVVTHIDMYAFLLHGDKSGDVPLLPGDILFIPEMGPQVAIEGDVNTPAIYELKANHDVGAALGDAGGLTVLADTARATLERIEGNAGRRVEEFALDVAGMHHVLRDGDVLHIHTITPRIVNAVTLRGNVIAPGRYAWHSGMRVSELIPTRGSLVTRAFYAAQNALPTTATFVTLHEAEINWSYAAIERLQADDLTTKLIPFALGVAVDQHGGAEDRELEPGDVIVIYSAKDMPLPQEMQARFVRIDGQVKAPGVYRLSEGETLRDAVARAGGLAPHAYLYAAQLTRESVRVEQEQRLHELMARINQEVLSPANMPRSDAGGKGSDAMAELALRQAYIVKLAEIHPTGRVVLRLAPLQPKEQTLDAVPEFALMDGDHFHVPSMPNTVDILGNVYNQGAVRYVAGQRARVYLDAAGGATRDGDPKREFVIRADGTLISRQVVRSWDRTEIYPGDAVIVPPQLRGRSTSLFWTNVAQMVGSFALSAVAIKALQ